MQYNNIKGTGLAVSKMCLGTMMFGGQTNEEESLKIIDYALDNGVNFFDTANIYTGGESERILGQGLKGKRERAIVATKVGGPAYKGPNGSGQGRTYILRSVEDSLRRLQTDYIDVLYMHFPDPKTPLAETIETMTGLVRSGKIRYYGVSNHSAWQLCSMVHQAKESGNIAPVITQTVYNPITRGADDEMLPFLKEYNIGMAAFNPIAGGLLSGKHTREKAAENSRFSNDGGYNRRYWKEKNFDAIDILTEAANELGISLLELSFRWHLSNPMVDSVISGVSKYSQVVQNIEIFSGDPLPKETLEKCNAAWDLVRGNYFNYHY